MPTGTVPLILAGCSRALVALENGEIAGVTREQVRPLVPLDLVLTVGVRVQDALDATGRELRLALETPGAAVLGAQEQCAHLKKR